MILYYADKTGAISAEPQAGFYPVYEGVKPDLKPGEQAEQAKMEWAEDHWVMTYRIVSAPVYTAGEWLELVGFGTSQQPTLIYLKLQLQAAGKTSAKLTATEEYLNGVLALFATNPTPRSDWDQPPYPFQEVVGEALTALHL